MYNLIVSFFQKINYLLTYLLTYLLAYDKAIHKAFIRTHLDYENVTLDQSFNNSFGQRLEAIEYNAVLEINGSIRGTSKGITLSKTWFSVTAIQKKLSKTVCLL